MRGGRAREQEMSERWMEENRREVRMEGRKGRDGKEGGDIFLAWAMLTSERQSSSINPKQNWVFCGLCMWSGMEIHEGVVYLVRHQLLVELGDNFVILSYERCQKPENIEEMGEWDRRWGIVGSLVTFCLFAMIDMTHELPVGGC